MMCCQQIRARTALRALTHGRSVQFIAVYSAGLLHAAVATRSSWDLAMVPGRTKATTHRPLAAMRAAPYTALRCVPRGVTQVPVSVLLPHLATLASDPSGMLCWA